MGRRSVARVQVLPDALQTDDGVGHQGSSPESIVVFAEVPGGDDGDGTFCGSNRISSSHRRMSSVEIGGLHFHVADVGLSGQPVLPSEQGGIGIGKGAAGRYDS